MERNTAEEKRFDIEEEFAGLDFHFIRLGERFIRTTGTLYKQPDKSVWEESADRAEAKAIYRMPGNESFDREEILKAHREATIGRMAGHGGTDYYGRSGYSGGKLQHPSESRMDRVYQR